MGALKNVQTNKDLELGQMRTERSGICGTLPPAKDFMKNLMIDGSSTLLREEEEKNKTVFSTKVDGSLKYLRMW